MVSCMVSCHAACIGAPTIHVTRSAPDASGASAWGAVHSCRQSWPGNQHGWRSPPGTAHGSNQVEAVSGVKRSEARSGASA